jgi:hypothetical protein
MNLNEVTYGNPTKEQYNHVTKRCMVDVLFDKLKEQRFPNNDSELVKDELNELVDYLKVMDDDENETYLKRYKSYDRNLIQVINATFLKKGIEVNELTHDIVKDIEDLIYKLKFYFQRPRPKQLAQYYKLKLFPYDSYVANTPSYPSGHTLQAFVILTIIGNLHPKEYSFCKEMIDDIAYSRLYMGVHFPSDNDFAKVVGEEILKVPEFAKKYGI